MNRLMTPLKILLAGMLALGIAAGASAQSTRQGLSKDSVLQTILQRGSINIGLSAFVPWAMRDKNGELIGFEIDVARKVAEDMGVGAQRSPHVLCQVNNLVH